MALPPKPDAPQAGGQGQGENARLSSAAAPAGPVPPPGAASEIGPEIGPEIGGNPRDRPLPRPKPPAFLGRQSYRARRRADAARLLPFFGGMLFGIPLLWPDGEVGNAAALFYLFGAWTGLIGLALLLARPLMRDQDAERREEQG